MKMIENSNFGELALTLERQEIENAAAGLPVPAENYSKLLALHLLVNDVNNAKFLWKRIPQPIKSSKPELQKIWSVGQEMWVRNFPEIYKKLDENWSNDVSEMMPLIKERVRERALNLIATAYSSISLNCLAEFTGLGLEETATLVQSLGWQVEDGATVWVIPKKPELPSRQHVSCEEQLAKLTDFVSFLEN